MPSTDTLTIQDLDLDRLRKLAELRDDAGVLTVAIGHDPNDPATSRAARTAMQSGIRAAIDGAEGKRHERLVDRIRELDFALDDLADPTSTGRGRFLVTSLRRGAEVEVLRVQAPLDHRVVVADHAWIRPLARLWSSHRPVRTIMLHGDGARVVDWSMGRLTNRWEREVTFGDAQLADVKNGPSGRPNQRGNVNKERFEDRLDANRARILRDAVREAVDEAKEAGIERLLVMGPAKIRDMIQPELDGIGMTVWTDDRDLSQRSAEGIESAVAGHVTEGTAREHQELVRSILETEAAGGPAAIGLAGVLRALNEGRVDTLVVGAEAEVDGWLAQDGRLSVHPGSEHEHAPEPRIIDRTVAAALLTDADIVVVPDEQGAQFGEQPIGALLRW